ncbi:hypothetical protein ZHAS_00019341 [Anopheles sinensis]|uniref:Uncharacterized protein n=1 Tax=Anopheles sinensis TaxID=74873 RepID=A0A084WM46_ANOSI|nr:hypothetical protein ZHAS_00019341 [Anopheles sinensis]
MDKFNKNNHGKDDHKSVSEQEASSSGTGILDGDSTTASDKGNFDQADQHEMVKSNEVMKPSQPKLVGHASPTNDGASNSGTLGESKSNKTHSEKENELKGSKDGASTKPRNLGMIDSLVGATYQQKLSIPMLCQVAKLIREGKLLNFTITNDDEEGGLFDDIVFKSDDGDLFIQAKHKEDKSYAITWDDLISTDKSAPFAISKYLNSFLKNEWDKKDDPPVLRCL